MPFFSSSLQRLRAVRVGVCVALFASAPLLSAQEIEPKDAVTERDAILKVIQSLPHPPTNRSAIEIIPPTISTTPIQETPAKIPIPTPTLGAVSSEPLRTMASRLKLPLPLPKARIVINKTARTLELFSDQTLVKIYRVALGPNPNGHKQNQGDGRTPEGQFYICTRNAKDSAFHIFLGLSYPALPDATRAVNQKIINWRDYQIIRQRLASRGAPLWGTRLGGWVGIHGGSNGTFAARKKQERRSNDWTAGCIALTDKEIAEIHTATILGTPVLVRQ